MNRSLISASCFLLLLACDDIDALRRERQIKTYWALTRAGIELTALSRSQSLTTTMVKEAVGRHLSGRKDFWGNQILILTKTTDANVESYVLVSLGSDGRQDRTEDEYFYVQPHSVRASLKLDLIVRDGEPISLAGK